MTNDPIMKLWNHLAEHGNLLLSAAMYPTEQQAINWSSLSDLEFKNPQGNARKEIAQLEELAKQETLRQELSKHKEISIFDLGSGDGRKAAFILDKFLPEVEGNKRNYYLVDESSELLRIAFSRLLYEEPTAGKTVWNPSRWVDGVFPLREFIKALDEHDFDSAFEMLSSEYSQSMYLMNCIPAKYRFEMSTTNGMKCIDLVQRLAGYSKRLYEEYAENKNVQKPDQLKDYLMHLREKCCHPGLNAVLNIHVRKLNRAVYESQKKNAEGCFNDIQNIINEMEPGKKQIDFPCNNPNAPNCVQPIVADLNKGGLREVYWTLEHADQAPTANLVLLLGNTLANFEEPKQIIRNIYHILPLGGRLILGLELAPNPDSPDYQAQVKALLKKYGDPEQNTGPNPADLFLRSTTRLLDIPDTDINFGVDFTNDTINMFYKVVNPEGLHIKHPYLKKPEIKFNEGDKINIMMSRKFHLEDVRSMLTEDSNFKIEYFPDRTDYAVVMARK